MREQEIELLNRIIYLNTMRASPQLIEAQESLAFEILQREQLGIVSPDFLENPIVNSFIQNHVTNPSNSLIIRDLTVPTPTNRSKKRTALSDLTILPYIYITAGPTDELKLSNLVKQMPSPLSGQTHFFVEEAVGLVLKNLPKTTQDKLGIGSIRKVRNKTQYKVEISNLQNIEMLITNILLHYS